MPSGTIVQHLAHSRFSRHCRDRSRQEVPAVQVQKAKQLPQSKGQVLLYWNLGGRAEVWQGATRPWCPQLCQPLGLHDAVFCFSGLGSLQAAEKLSNFLIFLFCFEHKALNCFSASLTWPPGPEIWPLQCLASPSPGSSIAVETCVL